VREGTTAPLCRNARWRGASVSVSCFDVREGMGVVEMTHLTSKCQMERCWWYRTALSCISSERGGSQGHWGLESSSDTKNVSHWDALFVFKGRG